MGVLSKTHCSSVCTQSNLWKITGRLVEIWTCDVFEGTCPYVMVLSRLKGIKSFYVEVILLPNVFFSDSDSMVPGQIRIPSQRMALQMYASFQLVAFVAGGLPRIGDKAEYDE